VTARTCRIADSKVAADKPSFRDIYEKRPDIFSGLFFQEGLSAMKTTKLHENKTKDCDYAAFANRTE
jgi:hypothetical protein